VLVAPGAAGVAVLADREDLIRVLINLVNNSIDALEQAGRHGTVRLASARVDGSAEITVEDDGPGLPPEVLDHLFEPYFSTKSHGTGLGLAIVKRTIEAFGGKVGIGPREGGGTRAVVRLNAVVAPTA
jgi:signal transduction histidine kinase